MYLAKMALNVDKNGIDDNFHNDVSLIAIRPETSFASICCGGNILKVGTALSNA